MSLIKRYTTADERRGVTSGVAPEWQYIIPVPETWDARFINVLVDSLIGTVGDLKKGTRVKAPHWRKHPIKKVIANGVEKPLEHYHDAWDVTFQNARTFTVDQLIAKLSEKFSNVKLLAEKYLPESAGNYLKFEMNSPVTFDVSEDIKHTSKWVVTLCHFERNGVVYKQGSTGSSTAPHVHIRLYVDGKKR